MKIEDKDYVKIGDTWYYTINSGGTRVKVNDKDTIDILNLELSDQKSREKPKLKANKSIKPYLMRRFFPFMAIGMLASEDGEQSHKSEV